MQWEQPADSQTSLMALEPSLILRYWTLVYSCTQNSQIVHLATMVQMNPVFILHLTILGQTSFWIQSYHFLPHLVAKAFATLPSSETLGFMVVLYVRTTYTELLCSVVDIYQQ